MGSAGTRVFKIASEPWEHEAMRRLNYQTFAEEIPQHEPNPDRRLADRMLDRSTCFICLEGERLIGMVGVNGDRPFSLDAKIPQLDRYLPPGLRPCEIRRLAVERERRRGPVFAGLLACVLRHAHRRGYDLGVISAIDRQLDLYRHLGFVPFGPPLGTPEARYQGMSVTWDQLAVSARVLADERGVRR